MLPVLAVSFIQKATILFAPTCTKYTFYDLVLKVHSIAAHTVPRAAHIYGFLSTDPGMDAFRKPGDITHM